jgi:ribonuclease D
MSADPAAPNTPRATHDATDSAGRAQHVVADAALFDRLLSTVAAEQRIALDTESNGFHAYFEKVCLVQIATRDADWAVDMLAVPFAPLVPLLADPAREVVLHAAEYDVLCLKRDHDLTFGSIFDTHAAAKTLGLPRVGLGSLLEDQLAVRLTVDEQRSDWGKRPLSPQQLEYAFADVRWLLALREKLGEQLEQKHLAHEAQAEFARLVARQPRPREFDPEGWQRMKAARTLDGKGRAVLRELFLLRDARAREVDRPPFKVLSDLFLAEAARRQPRSEEDVVSIPGASAQQIKRLAPMVVEAVLAGLNGQPLGKPRNPQRQRSGRPGAPPPVEVLERYERLRAWRKRRAQARGVEVQVIAPNVVLMAVAARAPVDLEALAAVEGMDDFRVRNYGPEILEALRGPKTAVQLSLGPEGHSGEQGPSRR